MAAVRVARGRPPALDRAPPPPPGPPDGDASGAGGASGEPSTGRSKKATLGSTSYDGADREPFDPDWGGASWYGTTSGTYWTINPKEYADPRKHGPEYQARARRKAAEATADATADDDAAPPLTTPAGGPAPDDPTPMATTESWWEATAGPMAAGPAREPGPGGGPNDPGAADLGATADGTQMTGQGSRIGRFAVELRRRVRRPPRP